MSQRARIQKSNPDAEVKIPEKGKIDVKSIEVKPKQDSKKKKERSLSYFQLKKELSSEVNRSVFNPKDRNDEYVNTVRKNEAEKALAKQVKLEYKRISRLQA